MSWIMLDYVCPTGHRTESLERRSDPAATVECPCGEPAIRTLSPIRVLTVWGCATSRGKGDELPPNVPDTSLLADGMPYSEWRARYSQPEKVDDDLKRGARRVLDLGSDKPI